MPSKSAVACIDCIAFLLDSKLKHCSSLDPISTLQTIYGVRLCWDLAHIYSVTLDKYRSRLCLLCSSQQHDITPSSTARTATCRVQPGNSWYKGACWKGWICSPVLGIWERETPSEHSTCFADIIQVLGCCEIPGRASEKSAAMNRYWGVVRGGHCSGRHPQWPGNEPAELVDHCRALYQ